MKKFIYTSVQKKDFGQTPKKELIYTSYNSSRYNETVKKLTKALNLADAQVRIVRTLKAYEFWSKQQEIVKKLLDKQYRLRVYDLKHEEREIENKIQKLSNEIKNSEKVYPDYRLLDLQRLINKKDRMFHELEVIE